MKQSSRRIGMGKHIPRRKSNKTRSILAYGILMCDSDDYLLPNIINNKDMCIFPSFAKAKDHFAYMAKKIYDRFIYANDRTEIHYHVLRGNYEHLNKLRCKLRHMAKARVNDKMFAYLKLKEIKFSVDEIGKMILSKRAFLTTGKKIFGGRRVSSCWIFSPYARKCFTGYQKL